MEEELEKKAIIFMLLGIPPVVNENIRNYVERAEWDIGKKERRQTDTITQ